MATDPDVQSRMEVLEALLAAGPAIVDLIRESAEVDSSDEFIALVAARLGIDSSLARIVANSRLEMLVTRFAMRRYQVELDELRRQSQPL
ncbi:hypothetical protein [Agreia sp. COWG]|uniref:hypothetical protein n=1 Tax=Agreia sp. COWG TaxID=2773266 RepID=UPI00192749A4|nr:hypothetical protein [Agreia sp. COWG]